MSTLNLIQNSDIRDKMKRGELVTAGWTQANSPLVIAALAEHKVIVIDAEHAGTEVSDVVALVTAATANGALCLVRVPQEDGPRQPYARRCLDAGVIGVLFPDVRTKAQAVERISVCYYPSEETPWGTRGTGFGQSNQFGSDMPGYTSIWNQKVIAGVQLEHKVAFEDPTLDDILATPGLIFTQDGPYDHSASYLVSGKTGDPRVVADLTKYRAACKRHGIVAGKHNVWPDEANIKATVADGYGFLALGTDLQLVVAGARRLEELVRKSIG